ncbi:MAG: hypothetical protein Tsb006_7750 [Rickettsiaceae bacterium]
MKKQVLIRKARLDETGAMQELMTRSLVTWGYTKEQNNIFSEYLKVTPEFVENSITYIAEISNEIKGFWGVVPQHEITEAKFYVDPSFIGSGIGTMLWDKVLAELRQTDLKYFTFLIERSAQGFYEKKGAVKVDEQESKLIKGNPVPVMRYYLKK